MPEPSGWDRPPLPPLWVRIGGGVIVAGAGAVLLAATSRAAETGQRPLPGKLLGVLVIATLFGLLLAITGRDPVTIARSYDQLPKGLRVTLAACLLTLLALGVALLLVWADTQV